MDLVELSRKSNCLLTGRPSGFGFLHPPGQGKSHRHFRAWQGIDRGCRKVPFAHSSGFLNPTTLAILETAFDEAWATLDGNGDKIRRSELARCMLRLVMEGERDPARLRERALSGLNPSRKRLRRPRIPASSSAMPGWCAIWPSTSRKSCSSSRNLLRWKESRPEDGSRAHSLFGLTVNGDPDPTSAGTAGEPAR